MFFSLQIVEKQEADDEAADPVINKGGKKQPRKKLAPKLETKPSPYGTRVVPRIDAVTKAIKRTTAGEAKKRVSETSRYVLYNFF